MSNDNKCYERARERGDYTFTLVGQDLSSPRVIAYWILENIETCPESKLIQAVKDAVAMRQSLHRKHAD